MKRKYRTMERWAFDMARISCLMLQRMQCMVPVTLMLSVGSVVVVKLLCEKAVYAV